MNNTVLVTGASGRLGGAVARVFAENGFRIAAHFHRGRERAHQLAQALAGVSEVALFEADLSGPAECVRLADAVGAWCGGTLHGVVHAAGGTVDGPVVAMRQEDWDRVVGIHLSAAWRLLSGKLLADDGFAVLIGSGAGLSGRNGQAAYAAAKAGLVGLAQTMAQALAPRGIRVNTVVPGPLETPMWHALGPQQRDLLLKESMLPPNRVEDVARFIVSLAALPATTGQVFCLGSRRVEPW